MTPQRLMIVRALRHAKGHVSAAQIVDEVRESYPFVDVSTVYRTLDVLKRMRLATATDMGQGDVVFEWSPDEPHHHLICNTCHAVQEISHDLFRDLEAAISGSKDFFPDMLHFAVFGTCRTCREAEARDDDEA